MQVCRREYSEHAPAERLSLWQRLKVFGRQLLAATGTRSYGELAVCLGFYASRCAGVVVTCQHVT